MKKRRFIFILLALVLLIGLCVFFLPKGTVDSTKETKENESSLNMFTMQYCIYTPKNSVVFVDNERVRYNDNLNCYEAIVKKGVHTLTVQHEGCEDKTVKINARENESDIKVDLSYTTDYISEGETAAKDILSSIIKDCWNLESSIDSFSFLTERDKVKTESTIDKIIMALDSNLSLEYSVSDISFDLVPLETEGDKFPLSFDSDGGTVYAFTLNYSYTYNFSSSSYSTSKEVTKTCTPNIVITRSNGVWNIKSLYLSLSNGEY